MHPAPSRRRAASRLRDSLRDLGKRAAGRVGAGLNAWLGSRAGRTFGILLYHRIAAAVPGVPAPTLNVTPRRFREQLAGLLARGFCFWPLRRVLQHRERGQALPPRTVVVTFDDGFANNCTRAWPVLRELGIPATVFVSTAFLDSDAPFPFDRWGQTWRGRVPAEAYRPLTSAECRAMAGSGLIDFGAHTHTHQDFRGRPEELRRDLAQCLAAMGQRFGEQAPLFAFPFGRRHSGHSGDDLVAAVRQAGVTCALTTEGELADLRNDPFSWGRFNAYDWDTSATLAAKLDGWYSWAPRLELWLAGAGREGAA